QAAGGKRREHGCGARLNEDEKSRARVVVERQEILEGGTGVVVNVHPPRPLRRSTLPSTVGEPPFTGRGAQMGAIDEALQEHGVVIVSGPPGLGKSRLAKEYAGARIDHYPGGTFFVRFGDGALPLDLARLLRDLGQNESANEPIEDRCRRALGLLGLEGPA